jgi:hypothetical protein
LEAGAVVMRQSFDCRPDRPRLGPMNSHDQHRSGSWSSVDRDYSRDQGKSNQRRTRTNGRANRGGSGWIETNPIPNVTVELDTTTMSLFRTG